MELRYLRYFVTIARTGHFTHAAEALGMSQPPLSQQIQRLEKEVGTKLFNRSGRGVELTEAGKVFYKDACVILNLADSALIKAKGIARGVNGIFSLGIDSSVVFFSKVFPSLRNYKYNYPDVSLRLKEDNTATLLNDLESEKLDAAFIRLPVEEDENFNFHVIGEEAMGVALHSSHALAMKDKIKLSDIIDTPFILFPEEEAPGLHKLICQVCKNAGINVENNQAAPQIRSAISMVQGGFGFTVLPESMLCFNHPELTYHRISDAKLNTSVALVWRKFDRSAIISRFLELL
ncbi:LysR family transcriptional regulator [Vagococcus sp. WN89Y]|uniref:LysR family transcriptional regulator n=1 Tax=Vagococcus sp. WN89Y TaxID=3457258 RepID=UPI003FCED39A